MNIAIAFVLGLLIGWLIEWLIDWFYWRKRLRALQTENTSQQSQAQLLECQQEKEALQKELEELRRKMTGMVARPPDNLQKIKGIGPKIAGLLNEAGIHTFQQLAELTPDKLRELVGDVIERLADEDEIIEQARQLAEEQQ